MKFRFLTITISLLAIGFCLACGGSGTQTSIPGTPSPSGVINQFGTYLSPDKRLSLVVSKIGTANVVFALYTTDFGKPLYSDNIGSDAQRWCFYWDEQGRLWAYSSDTGYFSIFTVRPDDSITKIDADKNTNMPQPIYDFLPSSLKQMWGI